MKAILFEKFGGPEQLVLRERANPSCGNKEVNIAIHAASVTPGDWKLRAGNLQSIFPIELPCIPGRDGAGVITKVGSHVENFAVGDAVCFIADRIQQGSYAEQIARPVDQIAKLPQGYSFAQGAALVHAATCAWTMLVEYGNVKLGQHVLIHAGSGAIGSMAIQLAKHFGAIITTTCNSKNFDYVKQLGAHHVIAYDKESFQEKVADVDVALDLIGGTVHELSREVLKPGGLLLWLVNLPFEPLDTQTHPIREEKVVISDSPHVLHAVVDLANNGILTPQVSQVLPLTEAAKAHSLVEMGKHGRGRIILDISGKAEEVV